MIEMRQGNLIDALLNGEVDFIFHCCNCQNNFGSGIAKEIRERIPEAYEADKAGLLGHSTYGGGVFNLYRQEYYGWHKNPHYERTGRQINYGHFANALGHALYSLNWRAYKMDITLGFPYKIGSDRAGGDWDVVKELVEGIVSIWGYKMVWYKLEE